MVSLAAWKNFHDDNRIKAALLLHRTVSPEVVRTFMQLAGRGKPKTAALPLPNPHQVLGPEDKFFFTPLVRILS